MAGNCLTQYKNRITPLHYGMSSDLVGDIEKELDNLVPSFARDMLTHHYLENLESTRKLPGIFQSNKYVYYNYQNQWYVDIHHILSQMVLSSKEYIRLLQDFYCIVKKEIFDTTTSGKLIKRGLIDFGVVWQILRQSHCHFAEVFRLECLVHLYWIVIVIVLIGYFVWLASITMFQ